MGKMTSRMPTVNEFRLLPPWLWFWLGVYLITLPNRIINEWFPLLQDVFAGYYTWAVAEAGSTPLFQMLRVSNILEIVPSLVVFVGVITLFLPRWRATRIERRYKLSEPASIPAVQEIQTFLAQYAPDIQLRANLTQFDHLAFAYPLGYRKYAIGIFGSLVKLWRSDKKAAQAILLHEIAHCRQGDVLAVGVGSYFEKLLSSWIWLFLLLGLFPLLLFNVGSLVDSWQRLSMIGPFPYERFISNIIYYFLGDIVVSIYLFLYIFSVFIFPLVCIWSSEFNADRFALETLQYDEEVTQALSYLSYTESWGRRLLFGLSHPPTWLRRGLSKHYRSLLASAFLILLYPLAYPIKILTLLASVLIPELMFSIEDVGQTFNIAIQAMLSSVTSIWVAMAVCLLIWPLIAPYWEWMFTGKKRALNWSHYGVYVTGACLVILATVTASSIIAASEPTDAIVTPKYESGQTFEIGEVIPAGGFEVVVLGWETITEHPDLELDEGKTAFVGVEVIVVNTSTESRATSAVTMMKLEDKTGKRYKVDGINTAMIFKSETPDGWIVPGEKMRGIVGFQVEDGVEGLKFIYINEPPLDMTEAVVELGDQPVRVKQPDNLSEESVDPIYQLHDVIKIGDLDFTVNDVTIIPDQPVFQPEQGMRFIAVGFSLENKGNKKANLLPTIQMKVKDLDGRVYGINYRATSAAGGEALKGDIAPGEQVHGMIGYQVPQEASILRFVFEFNEEKVFVELPIGQ
jgi:Zn-dependent protease with chaperone function